LKTLREGSLNRYNFTLLSDHSINQALNNNQAAIKDLGQKLMEAWMWLEHEGFIAPTPGQTGDWYFVTSKGQNITSSVDFNTYLQGGLFPMDLDTVLVNEVRPLFVRGDYDTAIFRAFKEVEVRVRDKGSLPNSDFGVDLMRKAFGNTGPLADSTASKGEQDAVRELFSGTLATFKNPSSHRKVTYTDPKEVIDVIRIANQLLRMVDRI
jgi:uncharacterized protein (TIGR02391 family)